MFSGVFGTKRVNFCLGSFLLPITLTLDKFLSSCVSVHVRVSERKCLRMECLVFLENWSHSRQFGHPISPQPCLCWFRLESNRQVSLHAKRRCTMPPGFLSNKTSELLMGSFLLHINLEKYTTIHESASSGERMFVRRAVWICSLRLCNWLIRKWHFFTQKNWTQFHWYSYFPLSKSTGSACVWQQGALLADPRGWVFLGGGLLLFFFSSDKPAPSYGSLNMLLGTILVNVVHSLSCTSAFCLSALVRFADLWRSDSKSAHTFWWQMGVTSTFTAYLTPTHL